MLTAWALGAIAACLAVGAALAFRHGTWSSERAVLRALAAFACAVAIVASALQLGERLRPAEMVGAACIGLALGLISWQAVRTHRRDEPSMAQE